jgi:hypothetical protein
MFTPEMTYKEIVSLATQMFPKFKIKYKDQDLWMKTLGILTKPFCPEFMTNYVTTWGYTVYFPSEKFITDNYTMAWKILCHELVHLTDYKNDPVGSTFSYICPQVYAVFAFGAVFSFLFPPASIFLLALLALGPWPSHGRAFIEMRAYKMTMAINYWRYGSVSETTKSWLIDKVLLGWNYYRMCQSRDVAENLVAQAEKEIVDGSLIQDDRAPPFKTIYDLLKRLGVAK